MATYMNGVRGSASSSQACRDSKLTARWLDVANVLRHAVCAQPLRSALHSGGKNKAGQVTHPAELASSRAVPLSWVWLLPASIVSLE